MTWGDLSAPPTQTTSIVSYNHLGNNDGKNLSAPQQFRSKEISKSNVVDDTVQANPILYGPEDKPDHCVSCGPGWGHAMTMGWGGQGGDEGSLGRW